MPSKSRFFFTVAVASLFFYISLTNGLESNGILKLPGLGTRSAQTLVNRWAEAYTYTSDFVLFSFDVADVTTTFNTIATNSTEEPYYYGLLDDYLLNDILALNLLPYPYNLYTVSLPYRLDAAAGTVVMTLDIVADVYLGTVQYWNDSRIVALNPSLTLPNQRIKPIVYTNASPASGTFSLAMSGISEEWNSSVTALGGDLLTFPISQDSNTLFTADDPDEFAQLLLSTDGSIGYAITSDLIGYNYSQITLSRQGNLVLPSIDTLQAALNSFAADLITTQLAGHIVNSNDTTAWPLCAIVYVILGPAITEGIFTCEIPEQLTLFVEWAQNNPGARAIATTLGYGALPTAMLNSANDALATSNCRDNSITQTSVIITIGLTSVSPVLYDWARVYTLNEGAGTTYMRYAQDTEPNLNSALYSNNMKLVATTEIFEAADYDIAADILQVPIYASGLAIGFNIPGISDYNRSITLSTQILAAIYNGNIASWDHESIVQLNPSLTMPSEPIVVIVYNTDYPNTVIFTETLLKMNTSYTNPSSGYVSWSAANNISAIDDSGVYSALNTSYSIGYLNYAFVKGSLTIHEALIVNSAKKAVGPYAENVLAAINDFNISTYGQSRTRAANSRSLIGSLAAGSGENSYPFSSYVYAAVRSQSNTINCEGVTKSLDFIVWTQSYVDSITVLDSYSAVSLPSNIDAQVLDALSTVTCAGKAALREAGCLVNGVICSDNGSCLNGKCLCIPGYSGTFCDSTGSSSGSTDYTTVLAGIFGTLLPLILICCCLVCIAVVVLVVIKNRGDRPWAVDFEEIELKQQIGAGGYGAVHKAIWKETDVAVKLLATTNFPREMKAMFVAEVKVMTQLRHPNVVLFMGACTKPPNLAIIMEYMELGSLYDVLHNELVPSLPMSLKIKLAAQAAQGMHFLHSSGILHRDLKSPNILLDDKWNAKVSDFGLTKFKQDSGSDIDKLAGSLYWTAPEILGEEAPFSEPSDVYSFGIILWELLTAKDPYEGMSPTAVAVSVLRDDLRPTIPDKADPDYRDLVNNCWDRQTDVRPSYLEIVTRLKNMASSTSTGESRPSIATSESNTTAAFGDLSTTASTHSSDGNVKKFAAMDRAAHAPAGEVVIIYTDIHRAGALWDFDPKLMKNATITYNDIVRACIREYGGYEVHKQHEGTRTGEGVFCIAFQKADEAVAWAIAVQDRLMDAEWDENLLAHPAAAEEWTGEDDTVIFKGLRVKMGMNFGTPRVMRDPLTRRIDYLGPVVSKAAKLASFAHGGQILVSTTLHKAIRASQKGAGQEVSFSRIDEMDLGEDGGGKKVYDMKPHKYAGRFFGGVSHKQQGARQGNDHSYRKFKSLSMNSSGSSRESDVEMTALNEDETAEEQFLSSANLCRWVIDFKDVDLGKQVGMGSYGMVYKARWKGVDVAVKRFIKQKLSERHMLDFRAEVAFLSEMHHPNIVLFVGACVQQPNLCILTEYIQQGSLRDVLANKGIKLPWQMRMKIAKGAALGVYYLHSLEPVILHRDLKSSNILIDENFNAKVADFGFARIKQDNATMTRCGSPCWTAPEIIEGKKYTEKADVYSFGIILWEILTRQQPYKGQNYMNVGLDVVKGIRPKLPSNTARGYAKLIGRCWHANADKRPSMQRIVQFFEKEEADFSSASSNSVAHEDDQAIGTPRPSSENDV